MSSLLGIDIGTSGTKALLADQQGRIVGAIIVYSSDTAKPVGGEHLPKEWLHTTVKHVADALVDLKALGLAGQFHDLVCLNKAGRVRRLAILWKSDRSRAANDRQDCLINNPALPGSRAPRILWVARLRAVVKRFTEKPSVDSTDRWLKSFSFWIPRRYREAVMKDVRKDCAVLRRCRENEWRVRGHIAWHLFLRAIQFLLPIIMKAAFLFWLLK